MITTLDKNQLSQQGISEAEYERQMNCFKNGFPPLKIQAAASVEKGILRVNETEQAQYIQTWQTYRQADHRVMKFVPASGAASRMFKNLFAFLDGEADTPQTDFEKTFFGEIHHFAFFGELDAVCRKAEGKDIDELIAAGSYKRVVELLLKEDGLYYGALPKGLLTFHRNGDKTRTPVEEHLAEAALYAAAGGEAHIHFTVSKEHRSLFEALIAQRQADYERAYGVSYDVTFSEQKPSTDTVAATPENRPFRTDEGHLLFRPGGHGALIENLNDLNADVVFIKNIDNVVPDPLKADTVRYKQVIAGVLVTLQQQAFAYLRKLESGVYTMDELREMLQFLQKKLFCKNPSTKTLEDTELAMYLQQKLNRPMRVCGMVKNEGEAGGGPFLAYNADGTISLQILESSQIDMNDAEAKAAFEKGSHFNPVDLVCGIRDHNGNKFHLPDFVDPQTGFISHKSKDGRELKALELPGLWNGAMSDWNTVFVEVPLSTFNPVKTVNDLLRPNHQ